MWLNKFGRSGKKLKMQIDYEGCEDSRLIALFIDGNETAFETLYYRHQKQLYGFLNNMIRNPAIADEVYSDTWLKVIDKLGSYRDNGKFCAWLFRIARNVFYDKCRRKKTNCEVEFDEVILDETLTATYPEPDRLMSNEELGKIISRGLEELSLEQREVFLLRQQDISFKEISEIQECSINTVLSRMQYALKSLRKFLNSVDNGVLSE